MTVQQPANGKVLKLDRWISKQIPVTLMGIFVRKKKLKEIREDGNKIHN